MNLNDFGDPICGFEWNISTTIGWVAMKLGTDIHDSLRMNWNNFDDPLTSPLAPSSGQTFHLSDTLASNQLST